MAPTFSISMQAEADEMPPQEHPSTYDIVRSEARDEVRQCLARLGFDVSKLETEDDD